MKNRWVWLALAAFWLSGTSHAETLRMAVTTSFHNSGLSDVLLPAIADDLGIEVQLLIVGTGQALRLGRAGDVDAVLVHSEEDERKFVEDGYAAHRREIMYNDFVVVGPSNDPAGIEDSVSVAEALSAIAEANASFVSRGDDSGTHKKELALWREAGIDPLQNGNWYLAVGAGMGAALNMASGMNAYILSDRASWLKFGNKGELALLHSGDPALFNQYSFLPVNPARHSHVNGELASQLESWLSGPRGRELIDGYKLNGEALFVHNASMR